MRLVVKVPSVQTWLVQKAASYLSSELNTTVKVDAVDIKLFRSVSLKGVFVQDLQQDTMVYIPDLEVKIGQFKYKARKLTISDVVLTDARIGIKHYKNPREYNIEFIIDYFSGSGKDTVKAKPWDVKVNSVQLKNCYLTYKDLKYNDSDHGIDWEDISLKKLNLTVEDVLPEEDTISLTIKHLSFVEKSGFQLRDFSSFTRIEPERMKFDSLHIESDKSDIHANLQFDFNKIKDFEKFITDVRWKGQFRKSKIDFGDLAYFAKELDSLNRKIELKGDVSGTVDRFKGRNIEIRYSKDTYFKGNVSMTGLPDFFETYMEVKVDELSFNKKDIETLPAFPFDSLKNIVLPDQIGTLGNVRFNGNFNGFYDDFVAYGNITTALGFLSSDVNLKIGDHDKQTAYKGTVRLFDFDFGKFAGISDVMGKTTLKAKVEGRGFEFKNIDAKVEGEVANLYFNNYDYSNIKVNGHFAQKMFNGDLVIADRHLDLDFAGEVDFHGALPIFNFNSSIRKADLTALKMLKRAEDASLSADVSISLTGNNLDNAQGTITVEDVLYSEGTKSIKAEKIFLDTRLGDERDLKLLSDFIDLQITGDYKFSALPKTLHHFVAQYIPILVEQSSVRPVNQVFNFKATLKKTSEVTAMFLPELSVSDGTVVEGTVNTTQNNISLMMKSQQIGFDPIVITDINIDGHTKEANLIFDSDFGEIQLSDSVKIDHLSIGGFTNRDTSSILVDFKGQDSSNSSASFYLNAGFISTGYTVIKLVPEHVVLRGKEWGLDANNYILADTTGLLLNEMNFISGDQELSLTGIIGADTSSKLVVRFKDFDASQANDFLSIYDVNVGGITNGTAEITSVLGRPGFNADLSIVNAAWFRDTLGDANLITTWNSEMNRVDVEGTVTRGGVKNIQINGSYIMKDGEDELDFTAHLQKTYVQSFGHYLEGLVSGLSGVASGDVYLKGSPRQPLLTGHLVLQKIFFTIDYLKTSYNFSTEVDILADRFVFKDIELNDVKGNISKVNGMIRHEHLDKFYFDIDIDAKKTQVLNTGPGDNDMYYGVAYATGTVSIKGYLDYIKMKIGLKTEKGTKLSIPLSSPEEISQSGFITFISTEKEKVPVVDEPDFSGIELVMDFDITPEAELFLVFDSKIGDVIEGRGKGNISMTLSPTEDLRMFGNFQIESGKYLFTMQNIINKAFTIEKGGTVRWTGDPYDAVVDITATYRQNAGLYDLFQDSSFRKSVPVELKLHLTEKLFNPNITFDIQVLNVDPGVDNQVKRLINTEEEKYRQAVALLVMKRFTTPSEITSKGTVSSTNVVGVNAYEMLSNQLSNWASQISSQVNVGVNYRPGDAITSEELGIALSTSILNDRVSIDGNVGVANSNSSSQNTSNLVGDFTVEVKANKEGSVRLKAFNRSNNNSLINNINSPYTQGVGVFFRFDFDNYSELRQKFKNFLKRKSKKTEIPAVTP